MVQKVQTYLNICLMHNLLVLDDAKLSFVQEPFLSEFITTYWNKIACVVPITKNEHFQEEIFRDVINRGYTVDWLFAVVPNPEHPLDIDWIFLRPRQAHPWGYGSHPAIKNHNGGGSTACLSETLALIEELDKDNRLNAYCQYLPELYSDTPPKTFEFLYGLISLSEVGRIAASPGVQITYTQAKCDQIHEALCLGLYGCSNATMQMQWKVESMTKVGSWTSPTTELADKVTLALRLAGKSDHHTEIAPSSAFHQWMGDSDRMREPLLIRIDNDVLFCTPSNAKTYACDAYFLDCQKQEIQRLGGNGGDPTPTLKEWSIHPKDQRLQFLFR